MDRRPQNNLICPSLLSSLLHMLVTLDMDHLVEQEDDDVVKPLFKDFFVHNSVDATFTWQADNLFTTETANVVGLLYELLGEL